MQRGKTGGETDTNLSANTHRWLREHDDTVGVHLPGTPLRLAEPSRAAGDREEVSRGITTADPSAIL